MSNIQVGTTITAEINQKLEECMMEEDRSRSQLIRKAIVQYVEAERNAPVMACALVDFVAQVNKIQRDYADAIAAEDMALLNEKLAVVLAVERR